MEERRVTRQFPGLQGSLLGLLLGLSLSFSAGATQTLRVYVEAGYASDAVGQVLVYEIRELIRKNSGMQLMPAEEGSEVVLILNTLDPEENTSRQGSRTAYSTVSVMKSSGKDGRLTYIHDRLGICGIERTAECAKRIVAGLESEVIVYRQLTPPGPSRSPSKK
jgi:hypothetical protein